MNATKCGRFSGHQRGPPRTMPGAVTLSDARILAFPVRSLAGVFAWVTCPDVLTRLSRDIGIVGGAELPRTPKPSRNSACCVDGSPLVTGGRKMILEEYEFSCDNGGAEIAEWVASRAVSDSSTRDRIRHHIVVLHDDDFTHFVRNATEIVARIGLDYQLKTVRPGALFYEEYLPAETLFYSLVLCRDSYRKGHPASGAELLGWLGAKQIRFLQIGGGETIGKGICAVRFVDPSTENAR